MSNLAANRRRPPSLYPCIRSPPAACTPKGLAATLEKCPSMYWATSIYLGFRYIILGCQSAWDKVQNVCDKIGSLSKRQNILPTDSATLCARMLLLHSIPRQLMCSAVALLPIYWLSLSYGPWEPDRSTKGIRSCLDGQICQMLVNAG